MFSSAIDMACLSLFTYNKMHQQRPHLISPGKNIILLLIPFVNGNFNKLTPKVKNTPAMKISGYIVDIPNRRTYPGEIDVVDGVISSVRQTATADDRFILPGFIDAHVHIESSMVVPSEFARMAVVHGTIATVSDPHEIANVCGVEGVEFMIENGKKVSFKFYFGAPSCV